ncbi:PAS domain-containing sensor histidine kinase [Aurantibacter sp.]|uniref:PAS domain-containing sensor histidine kinase n=1 Tax=Aurantibacter sp. TaxID=2807103 RepID=UPI0032651F15
MKFKQSRQGLINQIAKLKKQNEFLLSHTSLTKEEELELQTVKDEVEESEKYTQTLLNTMGDSVFVKNDKSELVMVNNAFSKMFNLPRNEIIGKTLAENVPANERESFLKIDNQVLADGIENINEETLTLEGKDTRIISTRKSRYINANGEKSLVGVIRDITERKKAEMALAESEANFRKLNATKDKLFSIIAHDLRGPISNVKALSNMIDLNDPDRKEAEEIISLINTTANKTLVLLDNLLHWARSQTGELLVRPTNFSIADVILDTIAHQKSIAKAKNIKLYSNNLINTELHTDENILKTVLRNLISNAIKFTRIDGEIAVGVISKDDLIEVSVSDNGVGMNQEKIDSLFEIASNNTTMGTAREKGFGFGLVLCKEFVNKLKGTIWAESIVGEGSKFKFTIPLNI